MLEYRSTLAAVCAFALLLTGCNTGNGIVTVANTQSHVRVVNLIPNAGGPINVTVDNNPFAAGLVFETLQPYQSLDSITLNNPTRTIRASVAGSVSTLITTQTAPIGQASYTYVMSGPITAPTGQLYDDTFTDPGAGNFNVRLINAAAGIGAVDVYLTAPGADLNQVSPSVGGVSYGGFSLFATVASGNLQLRVTPAGSKGVIFQTPPRNYAERAAVDVVVYSRGSSSLVNVQLLNNDATGDGTILNNELAQFKVVNASTVASPLNVFFDGALKLSNIPIAGATSYQRTTATAHTLAIEATATPGATLLTIAPIFVPATDSSVILEGPAGAMTATILADNNLPPGPGNARVRVVNATAGIAALDVFVNFSKQISGLPLNSGAYSLELAAAAVDGTPYQFSFNVAGTSQTVLTLPALSLVGTRTYTLYIVGPPSALTGAITQDSP
ncbi:MAG: DUF4397 domain-containing protein [Casimicrobiaceae bacterium]